MINDDLSKKKSPYFREKYLVLSYLKLVVQICCYWLQSMALKTVQGSVEPRLSTATHKVERGKFFKVENNSLELTRIFKESFKDQRWAWEESVREEKRDRDAEREKGTFRRQRHHQSADDGVDAETSLSLSLHLYHSFPPLHFLLTLTFGL